MQLAILRAQPPLNARFEPRMSDWTILGLNAQLVASFVKVCTKPVFSVVNNQQLWEAISIPCVFDVRVLISDVSFRPDSVKQALHDGKVAWSDEAQVEAQNHLCVHIDKGDQPRPSKWHHPLGINYEQI